MGITPTRTSEERTQNYVNSLPVPVAGYSGAVEQMVTDDGPVPMKDSKPAEKRPNAADQFRGEHEAQYEGLERPPGRCRRVEQRNRACPQLRDELERRRSTAKPIAIPETRSNYAVILAAEVAVFDPNCRKCIKEMKEREKKDKREKEKAERAKNRDKKLKSKVTKKISKRRVIRKHVCYVRNQDCQFPPEIIMPNPKRFLPGIRINIDHCEENVAAVQNSRKNNNSIKINDDGQRKERGDTVQNARTSKGSVQSSVDRELVDSVSTVSSSYPSSSFASVESYSVHSIASSFNPEPMV